MKKFYFRCIAQAVFNIKSISPKTSVLRVIVCRSPVLIILVFIIFFYKIRLKLSYTLLVNVDSRKHLYQNKQWIETLFYSLKINYYTSKDLENYITKEKHLQNVCTFMNKDLIDTISQIEMEICSLSQVCSVVFYVKINCLAKYFWHNFYHND